MDAFSPTHLVVLAVTPIAALVAALAVRRWRGHRLVRAFEIALAVALVAATWAQPVRDMVNGTFSAATGLPFHASDAAALLAALALVLPRQWSFELTWIIGLPAAASALLTPDLQTSFPALGWWTFVVAHAGTIIAALVLAVGEGMRLEPGALRRAILAALGLTAVAAVADVATGGNYMFLRESPGAGTPLDVLPWPWYLLLGFGIAIAAFSLVARALPPRGGRHP